MIFKGLSNEANNASFCGRRKSDFKILVTCFLYNDTIKEECNFLKIVTNVQSVFKLWRLLTLEGRIVNFESLAILKIISRALITPVLSHIIKAFETIQKSFLWNTINPKIKHKSIWKNLRETCLQNFAIQSRLTSL